MKALNLIEKALSLTDEPDTKRLLGDFLRANTIAKNEKFDLSKFVKNPKDDTTNISVTGIYHENGFRIATNGYILCVVDNDYPDEYEGKIISLNGEIIEGNFPKWQSILPNDEELKRTIFTKNVTDIIQRIREEQKVAKITNQDVFVKITREEETVYFDAKMFVLFLNFLKTFKTSVGIKYAGKHSYIFAKDGYGNLCFMMCRNVTGKYEYVVEIKAYV
jgi:hypothetical protein